MTDTAPLGQPPVAGRDKKFYAGHRDGKRPLKGDPLKGARDRYDVVVIGSGLGGLTAANILAANMTQMAKPAKVIVISSLGLGGSSPLIRCMLSLIAGPDNIRDTEAMDLLVRCAAHPFVVVRPAALADAPAKGAYRATEATGAALFPISRADVAKFLFDALTDKQWDYKAVQLYAA